MRLSLDPTVEGHEPTVRTTRGGSEDAPRGLRWSVSPCTHRGTGPQTHAQPVCNSSAPHDLPKRCLSTVSTDATTSPVLLPDRSRWNSTSPSTWGKPSLARNRAWNPTALPLSDHAVAGCTSPKIGRAHV